MFQWCCASGDFRSPDDDSPTSSAPTSSTQQGPPRARAAWAGLEPEIEARKGPGEWGHMGIV